MIQHRIFSVYESSQIGEVRRAVNEMAFSMGSYEESAGRAAIVATELASNLVKHATGGGEILLRQLGHYKSFGLEIISVDHGPGIENPSRMILDGVSTAGTGGNGLGAVRRLSQVFDLYTIPQKGTIVLAQLFERPWNEEKSYLQIGSIMRAKPGEDACGDGWSFQRQDDKLHLILSDGLGHGTEAAVASREAIQCFHSNEVSPGEYIQKMDMALRHTRGAAVAVASIDLPRQKIAYAAVGNISGRIISSEKVVGCLSYNGIVGLNANRFQEIEYSCPPKGYLILHSDGISSRWDISQYPGIINHHPSLLAALLYRDHARETDDATVVVVQQR
ncbi:SpoIIE family protein phosphatase [Heliobacterium chlorum]|uniref:SpoIIE family protein phosphatase n=1 Tax=Heliobacterium chlorum TaxID=2698 RepID=A0ABR7SZ65_HELCL|nr:ATP-binding SpoIIE family protein phosphatase [Heliobacterium chlorum]MBC9783828.1 SpoIIE family protein phosphatase [Heliobacterium chlorum]